MAAFRHASQGVKVRNFWLWFDSLQQLEKAKIRRRISSRLTSQSKFPPPGKGGDISADSQNCPGMRGLGWELRLRYPNRGISAGGLKSRTKHVAKNWDQPRQQPKWRRETWVTNLMLCNLFYPEFLLAIPPPISIQYFNLVLLMVMFPIRRLTLV